jgi:flagellar L-ring protein precursor FlgH
MLRLSAALIATSILVQGCATLQRIGEIGSPPTMTPSTDPRQDPGYRPVTLPMPPPEYVPPTANSLWRPGSHAFFSDPRAAQVGDIITVIVNIGDSAVFNNDTTATRNAAQTMGAPGLFGLQTTLARALPPGTDLNKLISTNTAGSSVGVGAIKRDETVLVRVAAVITQRMPNGNLALSGKQEVRVNSELRELVLSGVIRPQDIMSDNTVMHDRMAEARISYGGRGQLTDVQTARYGQQFLDLASPF